MPRILAQQPSWVARGSPGQQLFQYDEPPKAAHTPNVRYDGPLRKMAHRGTEVFVAVGNELRWADLSVLVDAGQRGADEEDEPEGRTLYRVLKTSTSRPIQQLSVSPSGDFIAILTWHTCHVAVLPASTHLHSGDFSPLRLKTFQVGPTAHVLERAQLMSAIWHPLSPSGNCLVTVTKDACVRLWELDRNNRSTLDEPSLAIDLKKVANATSTQADFSASKYGVSTGFSPDNVEMQVAAACFGGQGRDEEHGWSSMTLWVAMGEGDVYALCPLLPSKWRVPSTLLPSLSTSVVAKVRASGADSGITGAEKRVVEQQCSWLAELDAQDPMLLPGEEEWKTVEVYSRPEKLGAIPKLQGPFYMSTELESGDVTDIFVIAPKIDDEGFEEVNAGDGLSVGVVCLATSNSRVHICLDLEGVEAEWLLPKRSRTFTPDDGAERDLLLFETNNLAHADTPESWPTFTPSPTDRYELLLTTPSGVSNLDFKPWTMALEADLASESDAGIDFRLRIFLEAAKTALTQLITLPAGLERDINTSIALCEPASIGNLVLTAAPNVPFATLLALPTPPPHPYAPDPLTPPPALPAPEPRAPYQPPSHFFQPSLLPQLHKTATEKRLLGSTGDVMRAQVRFSPATLQLMTEAHRVLSAETHRLGVAAAELFRRCERMCAEAREQVRRVGEIRGKVDAVAGEDGGNGDEDGDGRERDLGGRVRMEQRIQQSQDKTRQLNERVEVLRRKMLGPGGQQLSAKEQAFASEVANLHSSIEEPLATPEAPTQPSALLHLENSPSSKREHEEERAGSLAGRFEAVRALHEILVKEVEGVVRRDDGGGEGRDGGRNGGKGTAVSEFRMRKLNVVWGWLERETALVEGVGKRLGRLSGGG